MIQIDIQAFPIIRPKELASIIEKKRRLPHAPRPLDTNQAVIPVDFIHQPPANRHLQMLHQILMCTIKCFHNPNEHE